jgi:glucose-6-phosphate isomerase
MQLAHNPITKILNEKLKSFDFNNLEYLMCQKERVNQFQYKLKDLVVDLTRQPLNQEIKNELIKLARVSNIQQKIQNMVSGQKINISENRSVGHFGLRNPNRFKSNEWLKLSKFTNKVLAEKKINHIINVGIGGSDLGPLMVNKALKPFATDLKISYASNVDPSNMSDILENCDPLKTLFIITSKSFGTLDTLKNAQISKNWLLKAGISIEESMVAITSCPKKAIAWGFKEEKIFQFYENIGGRYSLWSSVGMSIILNIGENHFKDFLNGAHTMDQHFINEDIENNIPIIMALVRIWNRNFLNRSSHCIVPYNHRLSKLPSWAQQLEMESNGKSTDINGNKLLMPASPIIWGEVGTNAQHSFFQFLHQGLEKIPLDILIARKSINTNVLDDYKTNHNHLVINAIAQAEALAKGSPNVIDKNKNLSGGRPSTIISWEESTPFSIGMLAALYENITISCGFIWNINSFDQWGIELGKNLASKIQVNKQAQELSPAARKFLLDYD